VNASPVVGFDLDMTLVDSAAGIAATARAALAEQGITIRPEQVWPLNGLPLERTMAALAPGADLELAVRRYRELYDDLGIPLTVPLPGAAGAIAAVHAAGGTVLVVSAKRGPAVHRVLSRTGMLRAGRDGGAVDEVAGDLFGPAKGPRLRASGAEVYVGDHPQDVEAAHVAGALAVGVLTGAHSAADLRKAGADAVLDGLRSFPSWFGARNSPAPGPET